MQNTVWLACTDRRDLSAAERELLAHALALATPPALVYGAHGKPELEQGGLRISLSHTRGAVACAVSAFPVGVDVEPLGRKVRDWKRLAERYYTPEERSCIDSPEQFLEVWTRKEAYLKRDGRGLSLPLRQINTLSIPGISTRVVNGFVVSLCGEPAEFSLVACRLEQFKKQDGENETTQRGLCYVGRTGPALEDGKRGVERL